MNTQDQTIVNALKIQPTGQLLAAGGTIAMSYPRTTPGSLGSDDFGSLLIFDISAETTVEPIQTRRILPEHGGISDICWMSDHTIAIGTTRGKIIIYSNRNTAVSVTLLAGFFIA